MEKKKVQDEKNFVFCCNFFIDLKFHSQVLREENAAEETFI
jgi:hypothetical protein